MSTIEGQGPIVVPHQLVTVAQGDTFDPLAGVSAVDDSDGDLTAKIVVSGDWSTQNPGSYQVIYSVADSAGNTAVAAVSLVVTERATGGAGGGDDAGSEPVSSEGTGTVAGSASTQAAKTVVGSAKGSLASTGAEEWLLGLSVLSLLMLVAGARLRALAQRRRESTSM